MPVFPSPEWFAGDGELVYYVLSGDNQIDA